MKITTGIPKCLLLLIFTLIVSAFNGAFAQKVESDERALINTNEGLGFQKDSLFLLNLRFRIQNRAGYNNIRGDNFSVDMYDMKVRRLRLRLDGYVLNPKIQYYIQMAFSRSDMDLESGSTAQALRDAIVYYTFSDRFYVGFGQSKLPGNRQRVVSSGNLQFADRSIANAFFNIDRDFGIFGYYTQPLMEESLLMIKGAISTGQGRNAFNNNDGFAYTGRLEFLPFGKFLNNGDYSEGDIQFEQKPKLSIAATVSRNHKAIRAGGQTGLVLYEDRNLNSLIIDGVFKYAGWAISSEYMKRSTANPITENAEGLTRHVYVGYGINNQVSKMVSRKSELAIRYAFITTEEQLQSLEADIDELLLGFTRYLNGHRIKVQANFGYRWVERTSSIEGLSSGVTGTFQVEFGI
ncbi:porin [Lunatimonas salinarum]|uniref:porin n=1 Tax=Lunatimonas salinarum TaxID=1774590 RepID=UPI001AE00774|nr:porin [Lunatimonas salinarum]